MNSWPGMCWAGTKGAFQARNTCHHFRRISQQLGRWLTRTPACAFPWSDSRLEGVPLLAFVIWTKISHPVGGMLRTQQRLSVLRDCASPGFSNSFRLETLSKRHPTASATQYLALSLCRCTSIMVFQGGSEDLQPSVALASPPPIAALGSAAVSPPSRLISARLLLKMSCRVCRKSPICTVFIGGGAAALHADLYISVQ
jgi:hypothetical protein